MSLALSEVTNLKTTELKAFLRDKNVPFKNNTRKADLVNLVVDFLESDVKDIPAPSPKLKRGRPSKAFAELKPKAGRLDDARAHHDQIDYLPVAQEAALYSDDSKTQMDDGGSQIDGDISSQVDDIGSTTHSVDQKSKVLENEKKSKIIPKVRSSVESIYKVVAVGPSGKKDYGHPQVRTILFGISLWIIVLAAFFVISPSPKFPGFLWSSVEFLKANFSFFTKSKYPVHITPEYQ